VSPENATDDGTADATPRAPTRVVVIAWLLAVVALAPPVTVLVLASRVLGGSLDRQYFGSYSAEDQSLEAAVVPPGIGFWDRWSVLVSAVPYEPALLTTTGVVALLAGLHLAGGSRWPLGQLFRWAAAAVAWLVAAMAATFLLLTLVSAQRPADEQSFFPYPSSDLLTLVAPGAAMAVVLGFAAVSGILLVGPAVPAPAREGHEAPEVLEEFEEPTGVEDGRVRSEVPAEPAGRRPEASGPAPVEPEPEPEPGREPVAFPRPSADEYAAYRRPAP
jgi:hypothetical protein